MHGMLPSAGVRSNRRRPKSRAQNSEPLPIVFRDIASLAFPFKTTAALGHLTGRSRSTIQTWLSGEHEPPASVFALVFGEIMRRMAGQ